MSGACLPQRERGRYNALAQMRKPRLLPQSPIAPGDGYGRLAAWREYVIARAAASSTFIKFCIVGTIGYLVNQFFLFLFYDSPAFPFLPEKGTDARIVFFTHPDVRLLIATVLAVELAILSNFLWHNLWTFSDRSRRLPMLLRWIIFNITSIGSPIISVTTVNVLTPNFGVNAYIANSIGVALGMSWNWMWNTRVIWRKGVEPF
jgi:putative flippase GtrA